MTKRQATISLSAMLLIGLTSPYVRAQDNPDTVTLKGIAAVWVMVQDLPDGAKLLGLSKGAMQTDVELKLRLAGIRVVTQEEGLKLPGSPFVFVYLNLTNNADVAEIRVELSQNARLERNGQLAPAVGTWWRGVITAHPTSQDINNRIEDLTDQFLTAWLSVNPKK
jgi:hypothetical protein